MRQHAIQVERVGDLAGEEWVQVMEVDSPRQEIGLPPPELARSGPSTRTLRRLAVRRGRSTRSNTWVK
jgi:hypothetical protein